jgi:preprotein translocase subunit SecD
VALGRRIGVVCIVVLAVACSSSDKKTTPPPPTSTTPTTTTTATTKTTVAARATTTTTAAAVPPVRRRDALLFREVIATLPYSGGADSCGGGTRVTPSAKDTPAARQVILPDRQKTVCYVLGPSLLNGQSISSATAEQVPTTADWSVTVHFSNNDFVTKVASPLVGKQLAIIFDHVVQSAPVIRENITTPDVSISANFTEAEARALVGALR